MKNNMVLVANESAVAGQIAYDGLVVRCREEHDVDQRIQRELDLPSSWSNDDLDVDPRDRGTKFRNASEETSPTHSTATHLVRMIWTLALETRTSVMRVGMPSDALHNRTAADRSARVNILGD